MPDTSDAKNAAKKKATAVRQASFNIDAMKCPKCVDKIQKELLGLSGVIACSIELGAASVTYDPQKQAPEAIANHVTALGFPTRRAKNRLDEKNSLR